MSLTETTFLFGSLALSLDLVWASICRFTSYNYSKAAPISLLIYFASGYVAAQYNNLYTAVLVGFLVAGIEATIGWWISWVIGPGRIPNTRDWAVLSTQARIFIILQTIFLLTLSGGALAFLGASLYYLGLNSHDIVRDFSCLP
jgi:hypothetical protein